MTYTAPVLPDMSDTSTDPSREYSAAEVTQLYRDLAAEHPGYITESLLGTEPSGKELWRFDFTPPRADQAGVKIPKIILTAGTHGYERAAPWVLLHVLRAICENWAASPALERLRWDAQLIVVPIQNPYGWDQFNNRYGDRTNSNGVDLARNWPAGWQAGTDPASTTYAGPAPLSEVELQYVNAIIETERNDLVYIGDYHNFASNPNPQMIWNAAATNFQINLGEHLVRAMSRKWKAEHPGTFPQDDTTMVGYADLGAPPGSLGMQAASLGVHGGTFETCDRVMWDDGPNHSQLTIQLSMEALVTWLNLVIHNAG